MFNRLILLHTHNRLMDFWESEVKDHILFNYCLSEYKKERENLLTNVLCELEIVFSGYGGVGTAFLSKLLN